MPQAIKALTACHCARDIQSQLLSSAVTDLKAKHRASASGMDQFMCSGMSVPVQVDVEEIEDGGIAEPDPGVGDKVQAAAEAVAVAEQPERELHSFEIDPAQVLACTQSASSG